MPPVQHQSLLHHKQWWKCHCQCSIIVDRSGFEKEIDRSPILCGLSGIGGAPFLQVTQQCPHQRPNGPKIVGLFEHNGGYFCRSKRIGSQTQGGSVLQRRASQNQKHASPAETSNVVADGTNGQSHARRTATPSHTQARRRQSSIKCLLLEFPRQPEQLPTTGLSFA